MKAFPVALVAVASISLAGCGLTSTSATSTSAKQITIAGNGGQIEDMFRESVIPAFKEKYGIDVTYTPGLSNELVSKLELNKKNPQIDMVLLDSISAVEAADKGLIQPLTDEDIPALATVDKRYRTPSDSGVPVMAFATAIGYNPEVFAAKKLPAITSWKDLANPAYRGLLALPDASSTSGFTMFTSLALANGGSLDDSAPGLALGKEVAAHSDTFYKNSTQIRPVMQQGAALTVQASYTLADMAAQGTPIKMVVPTEGVPVQAVQGALVAGSKNAEAARNLLAMLLEAPAQTEVAGVGFYPVTADATLPADIAAVIALPADAKTYQPDYAKVASIRTQWSDQWTREVLPQLAKDVR